MKIVYLHQYYNRPSDAGSSRSHEMAKRLVSSGHEVHIVTSNRRASGNHRGWTTELIEGVVIHRVDTTYSNDMRAARRIAAFVQFAILATFRARRLRGDLVFATSTPLTITIPGMLATLFRPTPLVVEIRDLWPEVPIAMGFLRHPVARWAARALEKLAYRRSAHIVALSPGMRDGIIATGVSSRVVTVIPNAADLELFDRVEDDGNRWRRKQGWLGSRPLVVHCGTMGRVNGVDYLVRLAERVRILDPEICFATVGTGSEEQRVRDLATSLGVLDVNFFMLGSVPKSAIPQIFAASTLTTCLVIPVIELENNSANKFFDSLAAGRPIAINYGGWQLDIIDKYECGLGLPPLDVELAAHRIIEFIRAPDLLKRSGDNARMLGEDQFSRDELARTLEETLVNVARSPSTSRHSGCLRSRVGRSRSSSPGTSGKS